jgi:hypothetical protein
MTRLIFLDIDGVLNSSEFLAHADKSGITVVDAAFDAATHIDAARVDRLNRLVSSTVAQVVLSSSWRLLFGMQKTEHSLKRRGFAHSLSGETPRIFGSDRHDEIKAYLARVRPPLSFVVLDDDTFAGEGLEPHFVHVPDGLEDEHVDRARGLLLGLGTSRFGART